MRIHSILRPAVIRPARALAALLPAAALVLASCEHKGFCDPEPAVSRVHVTFDWRNAPGATAAGMSLYLYPEEGGEALRYEFPSAAGGTVEVPHGSYRALFVNSGTETLLLRGTEGYGSFEGHTRPSFLLEPLGMQGNPEGANDPGEPVVLAPDRVWAGREPSVRIQSPAGPSAGDYDQEVTLYPGEATCTYSVEIRGAQNVQYVVAASFSLSGLAGSFRPSDGVRPSLRATVPFEGLAEADASRITGTFHNFGTADSPNGLRMLTLYVVLTDGSRQYYSFDVSGQVNAAADPRRVHIVIEGLTLPRPIVTTDGGLRPTVDDWAGEDVELDL